MTDDIRQELAAAAEEYANRLAAKREAESNPGKTTAENSDRFAKHIEQQLQARREESGIEELLG